MDQEIVELPVNRERDPHGRLLAAALNAQFEMEKAAHRRRISSAALALLGAPAILALAFPGTMGWSLRTADLTAWLAALAAFTWNLASEIIGARQLSRISAALKVAKSR